MQTSALWTQALLPLYLEVIEWVDLFPWNDVRGGNGQQGLDIALGVLMVAAIVSTYRRMWVGMAAGVVLYATWLVLQISTFWTAYIGGASPQWQRIHARFFAKTIQWLPTSGSHLPPDASHLVLQLILVVALVATLLATTQVWRGKAGKGISPRARQGR